MYLSSNHSVRYFGSDFIIHSFLYKIFIYADNEIDAQNFARKKRVTTPVEYKTGSKFGKESLRGETVAYIALSDEVSILIFVGKLNHFEPIEP